MLTENNNTIASEPIFYTALEIRQDSIIRIEGEEASHILQSRRLKLGQTFFLTDGQGVLAKAVIDEIFKKQWLTASIQTLTRIDYPEMEIILASAIAKGERQADYLSMATQLGMNAYIPLVCEHSVVAYQQRMMSRWQRIIVESSKQCRQCFFPKIKQPQDLRSILLDNVNELIIVADVMGMSWFELQQAMIEKYVTVPKKIILLVGPEGGFSGQEKKLLEQKGVVDVCLSKHILRIETAVSAMLVVANQITMNKQENFNGKKLNMD